MTNLGADALASLKHIWDSHSPSVAFSIEGGNAADGVVAGITKGIPAAVRASQSMADQVLGAMSLNAPSLSMGVPDAVASMTPMPRAPVPPMLWTPPVNSRSLGVEQSYGSSAPTFDNSPQPTVAKDSRVEALLQQLVDNRSGGGDGAVITVRAAQGSSAEVSEQPKGGMKLKLQPSGGL